MKVNIFKKIILISILTVALVPVSIYSLKKWQIRQENYHTFYKWPEDTPKELLNTTDWKTYTDSISGFKFEYPPEFKLDQALVIKKDNTKAVFIPSDTAISEELKNKVMDTVKNSDVTIPADCFIITGHDILTNNWRLVTLDGISRDKDDGSMCSHSKSHPWGGYVLLYKENGVWLGAISGSIKFSDLIEQTGEKTLHPITKDQIDPLRRNPLDPPFKSGVVIYRGILDNNTVPYSQVSKKDLDDTFIVTFYELKNPHYGNFDELDDNESVRLKTLFNHNSYLGGRNVNTRSRPRYLGNKLIGGIEDLMDFIYPDKTRTLSRYEYHLVKNNKNGKTIFIRTQEIKV